MDESDKRKIEKIINDRRYSHSFYFANSDVYNSFLNMEQKTFEDKNLDKKTKELIAIGISIVINCESCLEWHIHESLKEGANEKEVIEAVEVGIEMGGGSATVSSRFALKILEYYREK